MGAVDMPDKDLMDRFGFCAAEEYEKTEGVTRITLRQWFDRLEAMDDAQLFTACKDAQRDSLISESQRGTDPRVYFKMYACQTVAKRRYKAMHSKECPELSVYQKALDAVRLEFGFEDELGERMCNCDRKGQS